MRIIESVLKYNGNLEYLKKVYKHYTGKQLYLGKWEAYIGEEILEYIDPESDYYIENPFNSYEAFLNDENCEREDWLFENDLDWYETLDYFVEVMFESDLGDYIYLDDVEGFEKTINEIFKETGTKYTWSGMKDEFLLDFGKRCCKNVKKTFGLDYRNFKNKYASDLFTGMISGYYEEEDFEGIMDNHDNYKFNTSNFVYQSNLDLACKFIDNTLSIADKAEAIILFNDIKERLIAA
jgi:hypothetical protein